MRVFVVLLLIATFCAALAAAHDAPANPAVIPSDSKVVIKDSATTPTFKVRAKAACSQTPDVRQPAVFYESLAAGCPESLVIQTFPAYKDTNGAMPYLSNDDICSGTSQLKECCVKFHITPASGAWPAIPERCFDPDFYTDKTTHSGKTVKLTDSEVAFVRIDYTTTPSPVVPTADNIISLPARLCLPLTIVPLCTKYSDFEADTYSFFRLHNPNPSPLAFTVFTDKSAIHAEPANGVIPHERIDPKDTLIIKAKGSVDKCCRKSLRLFTGGVPSRVGPNVNGVRVVPSGLFDLQDVDLFCPRKCVQDYTPDVVVAHDGHDSH